MFDGTIENKEIFLVSKIFLRWQNMSNNLGENSHRGIKEQQKDTVRFSQCLLLYVYLAGHLDGV